MAEHSNETEKLSREMIRAAREMSRAAEDMSKAAQSAQLTWRDYERLLRTLRDVGVDLEKVGNARIGPIEIAGLPEEEAAIVADEAVHRIRKELSRDRSDEPKAPPPTTEEIEEYERRWDERQRRKA